MSHDARGTHWGGILVRGAACVAIGCTSADQPPGGGGPVTPTPPGAPPSGVEWGAPETVPVPAGLAWRVGAPALGAGADGLHLAFVTINGPTDVGPLDVFHMRYGSGGWGEPANVSRSPTPSTLPRVGVDARGAAHVVWGERTHDPTPAPGGRATDVVHAVLAPGAAGAAWSAPETLYRDPEEGLVLPSSVVALPDGSVHVAYVPRESVRPPGVQHRRWAPAAGWAAAQAVGRDEPPGLDADLAADRAGRLWLTFIGNDTAGARATGGDVNSVLVTRSADGGRTWDPARVVSRSGRTPALSPRVVVGSDGAVHVAWRQDRTGDLVPEAVWHSVSGDGGATWSAAAAVPAPGGAWVGVPQSVALAADSAGGAHLAFVVQPGVVSSEGRAYYLRWAGGRWSAPEQPLGAGATRAAAVGLAVTADDRLHALVHAGEPNSTAFVFPFYHVRAPLR